MERKAVELTKELMRFKSMHSRPEEIEACLEHIRGYLQEWGVENETIVHNGVHSLLALPKPGYAPVLLMTHVDVVDGEDRLFEPVEENGRLYGRGSIDDKYAVAVSLLLLRAHLTELEQEGGSFKDLPFGLLITGDEEVGGIKGAGQALKHCRTDFCLALDGGGPRQIVIKEKGILRLKLVARGKAAHGARPWLGENAIERLMADVDAIKPFFPVQTGDSEHWHRTMNLGRISGGKAVNQVPDRAEAIFDIRYTEDDDLDRLVAELKEAVQGELSVEAREPMFSSGESPYLDRLLKLVPPDVRTGVEHGASDIRYFAEKGVPGVVWGADGEMSAHSVDEHLVVSSLQPLFDHLDAFLRQCRA